jgi:predicted membrane-bound mannosyltransferase
MTEPQQARWFYRLELLVLAVGAGLRLARFMERRPLWLDEALLALNLLTRPPLGYLRPLEHNQVAPVGFLWGEWFAVQLGGTGERALRFLPLVGAIAALIAFARLARRTLEPGMALLATTLAALSPLLIYYSPK